MIPHTHTWTPTHHATLTLPDHAGFFEQAVVFLCPCGRVQTITGLWHHQTPPQTLAQLDATALAERRAGGLLARQAVKNERRRKSDASMCDLP